MNKIILIAWMATAGILFLTACRSSNLTRAEQASQSAAIAEKLNGKNFVFEAQDALPTGGRNIPLTSYYSLKVHGDTLASTLPYFGRAFNAPMNPGELAYIFDTNEFKYDVSKQGSGEWLVTITPENRIAGDRFRLTAFNNGTASLQVTSNNRQPITFRGRIK